MSVTLKIPTQLRSLTGDQAIVTVEGRTVRELLTALELEHPGVRGRLLDDEGALRRFVNVYVGDEDIRFLEGLETPVGDGSTVSLIPAVAGGS